MRWVPVRGWMAGSLLAAMGCSDNVSESSPSEAKVPHGQDSAPTTPAASAPTDRTSGHSQSVLDKVLERPVAGDSDAAMALMQQARQLMGVGRTKEAADCLTRAVEADPASIPARTLFGEVMLYPGGHKSPSMALDSFRMVRMLEPDNFFGLFGEARARCHLNDDERSMELFGQVAQVLQNKKMTLTPRHQADFARCVGQLHYRASRWEKALASLDRALQAWPEDRRAMYWKTLVLTRMERFEDALQQVNQAIERKAGEGRMHFARADVLRRLGRLEEAEKDRKVHQILSQFEDDDSRRFREDVDRRIDLRKQLVEIYPEYRGGHRALGREYLDGGRPALAVETFTAMLEEDPDDAETEFLLAQAHAAAGNLDEARRMAQELLDAQKIPERVHQDLLRRIDEAASGS